MLSYIHFRAISGRCVYWASDVEPRESGSRIDWGETPKIYIGGVRREAHAVGSVRVKFGLNLGLGCNASDKD